MWLIALQFSRREFCVCVLTLALTYTQVWPTDIYIQTQFTSSLPPEAWWGSLELSWPAVLPPECLGEITGRLWRGLLLGGLYHCVRWDVEGLHPTHCWALCPAVSASCPQTLGNGGLYCVLEIAGGLSPLCRCFWNAFCKDCKEGR